MAVLSTPILRGIEPWRWYLKFYGNPLATLAEVHRRFGPMVVFENTLRSPSQGARYALVAGGALNREVLGRPGDFRPSGLVLNGPAGSALQRIRHGIFQMNGEVHRRHRRMIQPSFSKASVSSMVALMSPLVDEILDRWELGQPLDMFAELRTLARWVAANVLFGNEDFAASVHVASIIDRLAALDAQRRKWAMIADLNLPGTPYRRALKQAEVVEKAMLGFVKQKRSTGSGRDDVLSVLIRATDSECKLSDNDLIAHSVALFGASFETTASSIAWTLFLLAQHPGAAARLHDEVSQQFDEWPPTAQKLESLPFLDAVVCESMRLLPPVPVTFRRVTGRVDLHGVQLARGHKVILSQFLTHRDPAVFPNPDQFDPMRWYENRPDPYQYMPFSVGPRLCPGAYFAMTEIKLVVARVMTKFRITMVPETRVDPVVGIVLTPRNGLHMTVHQPDRAFRRTNVRGTIHHTVDLTSPELDAGEEAGLRRPGCPAGYRRPAAN